MEARLSGRRLVWTFVISLVLLAVVLFFLSRMMQKPRERRGGTGPRAGVWVAPAGGGALLPPARPAYRAARCTSSSDTSVGQMPLTRDA
ncbi:MAG: hypothetical protein AB7Q17_12690 [Phycisphaerae bacterium]